VGQYPLPEHGLYQAYATPDRLAQLTVRTAPGAFYLINFEDAATGSPAMLFFAYGGLTLNSAAPLGTFTLKYATGQSWCGDIELFGDDTVYSQADDLFTFERRFNADGYTASHWTVELILQPHGNLRTKRISREAFSGTSRRR
jgi:hypothetical protein